VRNIIKTVLAVLLFSAVVIATISILKEKPGPVYGPGTLIRLHVIANSDSVPDQDLKRKVRDEIVSNVAPEFIAAENINSARMVAGANLTRVREIAARTIKAAGKNYPVTVQLDRYAFPTKHYGLFILPAGDYEAVRVVLGSGGGSNWWCVLFPPLCFVDLSQATATPQQEEKNKPGLGLPGSQNKEVNPKIEYRFKLWDLFQKLKS
jgi:stage II sporulation protein R